MDFFNIGTGELLVLALLALILFGPQDMVKAMRTFSRYLNQFQHTWRQIQQQLHEELLAAEAADPTPPSPDNNSHHVQEENTPADTPLGP